MKNLKKLTLRKEVIAKIGGKEMKHLIGRDDNASDDCITRSPCLVTMSCYTVCFTAAGDCDQEPTYGNCIDAGTGNGNGTNSCYCTANTACYC